MKRINTSQISLIALGAGINIAGSTIALFLRLPIYENTDFGVGD